MRKSVILFTILASVPLLFISDSPAYYLSDNLDNSPALVTPDDPDIIDSNVRQNRYVPDEIIVKYKKTVSGVIDAELSTGRTVSDLALTTSLDKLHKKYRLRKSKALFENFRQRRQLAKGLLAKDKTLLSKKERRILKRLKRAPKGAKVPDLDRIYKLEVELEKGQSLEDVVAAYNADPDVEYAELNYIVSINLTPNDPYYSVQWALHNTGQSYPISGGLTESGTLDSDVDAPEAWDIETGSLEVIVAVVDTGVDYNHSDLDDNMWTDGSGYYGYDFINDDNDPLDDHGHGTHCSGIIAAEGNNGLDVVGVCWDAKIMALKFLGSNGSGNTSDAVTAFYYAVDNGADVVSNSWGGGGFSQSAQDAIDYAYSQGVIMIAAAGNDNSSSSHYPASYDHMISVAATDSDDVKASFSNYGDWIDIAAPGVNILSLRAQGTDMYLGKSGYAPGDRFVPHGNSNATMYIASGTSMACPYVAGAAAMIISQFPELSGEDILARLLGTTENIHQENPEYEYLLGLGRVNLFNAVSEQAHPYIIFEECVILDNLHGNNNGILEAGETAQLVISLKNIWADANDVSVQLDSSDPYVVIIDNSSDYGDIGRDETKDNANDVFEVSLSEQCPGGHRATCYLTVTTGGGYTNVIYYLMTGILKVPEHFSTIQSAVDASRDGDTIIVADGTYTGQGNRDIDFYGKGITIKSKNGPAYCIIDCQGSQAEPHRAFYMHSGEERDSVIDGFTIINGYAPFDGEYFNRDDGGAICIDGNAEWPWVDYTSPTVKNCIMRNNSASYGGGIFMSYGEPMIINCEVSGNQGDGIYYRWHGSPTISHCKIVNNTGMGVVSELTLEGWAGMIIKNSLIADNGEGGIYLSSGRLRISGCTIVNNKGYAISGSNASLIGLDPRITVANSIVWGNTLGAFYVYHAVYTLSYSNIQGGKSGTGNIYANPEFYFSDDYHLTVGSPCIDAGTNDPFDGLGGTDLDGNERLQDGNDNAGAFVDMGAYEYAQWNPSKAYIHVNKHEFNYICEDVSPTQEEQLLEITNVGVGTLDWQIIEDCDWLEAIPSSGQSTGETDEVVLRVNTLGLSGGAYDCVLTILDEQAANSPQLIRVNLSVGPRRVPEQYPTIQAAIDASFNWETVLVADGTYTGIGNREINFWGKAITVMSENGPENCIIDCENSGRGFDFYNRETTNSILNGFTIINGQSLQEGDALFSRWGGGGIRCELSSPTIINCKIMNCQTDNFAGGGIYCKDSSAVISNCVVSGNITGRDGGGIYCSHAGSVTIENCVITNNTAPEEGGGITIRNDNNAKVKNCLITGNSAGTDGGGVYLYNGYVSFDNCTIANNSSAYGGAIYCKWVRDIDVTDCILWGNTPAEVYVHGSSDLTIEYSAIQGGWSGQGNINTAPLFVTGPGGDYYLSQTAAGQGASSPCVDTGSDTVFNLGLDIYTTRSNHTYDTGTVDMGYHYFVGSSIADLDNSADVDYIDFGLFGLDWLKDNMQFCEPNEAAWWSFDEGAGITAYDSSGYGHDGALIGDPNWVTGYDETGSALSFNGVDEYIEVTGYKGVSGTQSRTCAAWIKTSSSINQAILFWGDMENGTKWKFYFSDYYGAADLNHIQLSVNGGYVIGTTDLIDGQWHHVAAVLEDDGSPDASEIKLYVDGTEETYSRVLAGPIDTGSSNDVLIGAILGNSGPVLCQFDGLLDDVRIYDFALTDEMIDQLYNGLPPSGLVCTEYPAADFTRNCIVDINDLRIFAENWLWP